MQIHLILLLSPGKATQSGGTWENPVMSVADDELSTT
jgi:hypothetical protein